VKQRFDALIDDLRDEFKDRFGSRVDWRWNGDYDSLYRRYTDLLRRHFQLSIVEFGERRERIRRFILFRLIGRLLDAIDTQQLPQEEADAELAALGRDIDLVSRVRARRAEYR